MAKLTLTLLALSILTGCVHQMYNSPIPVKVTMPQTTDDHKIHPTKL